MGRRDWTPVSLGRTSEQAMYRYRLASLRGMQHAETVAAVGPDQHQRILSFGHAAQCFLYVGSALHWLAIDFHDHVALL